MIRRSTLFYHLFPSKYVDGSYDWEHFGLEYWSEFEYEWEQDRWSGLLDRVSLPEETIESGRGDCEDYALVAHSYLDATTDHDLRLAFLLSDDLPPIGHTVVYDEDEEEVYSSGEIYDGTLEEYRQDSKYRWMVNRKI